MVNNRRIVLHVDNDVQTRDVVASELSQRGYEVVSIEDAERVFAELADRDCRVVLMDIKLAGVDGLDLLKNIKEDNAGIQVIILTEAVSMSAVLESMRRGAEACLFKPLSDVSSLQTALEAAFNKVERWWSTLIEWRQRTKKVGRAERPSV